MSSRTFLLTGATSGIGRAMAAQLVGPQVRLVLASRSRSEGEAVVKSLESKGEVLFRPLDLSSQRDVRGFAERFLAEEPRLDVLINNAGCQSQKPARSVDGLELVFATNVVGPFLLTRLLLERLKACAPARIVNTASTFAKGLDLEDLDFARRAYSDTAAYQASKQADRLFTWALARRLEGTRVTANAFSPGLVTSTGLYRDAPRSTLRILKVVSLFAGRTAEQGADTGAWLATAPELEAVSGRFYEKRKERPCEFRGRDAEEALWATCCRLSGLPE
ncbi:MAG: SDR family NAD(P)-dependent oxidoreductase [Myxococcaceae bacterium]|nr:SDR family NAD(P)-dependent oxidoreductase [Myxococcaceae bacterium]